MSWEEMEQQMNESAIFQFHPVNGNKFDVYTEGERLLNVQNKTIIMDDENEDYISYTVSLFDDIVFFDRYEDVWLGFDVNNYLDEFTLDLSNWDIMIIDTEAEIFITWNWDVYRIPFRYLLLSGAYDDTFNNPEYLGNYTPSVVNQILGLAEIRGKLYDIDRLK